VSIGPCVAYSYPGPGGKVALDEPPYKETDTIPSIVSDTVNGRYPDILNGKDCLECRPGAKLE
jgi:hypothetical protein